MDRIEKCCSAVVIAVAIAAGLTAAAQESAPAAPPEAFEFDAARPAAGLWIGDLGEGARKGFSVLEVAAGDGDVWSSRATALLLGAIDQPGRDLRVDGRDVSLRVGSGALSVLLEGRVSADGQILAGTTTAGGAAAAGRFELRRMIRPVQTASAIVLSGKVKLPGDQVMGLNLAFGRTPGGTWVGEIAIPQQGLRSFPLVDVHREGDSITATLRGPADAVIRASFSEGDTRLTGNLEQMGLQMPLELSSRGDVVMEGPKRPQTPKEPFPYEVEQFTASHPDGHELAGTLTMPSGAGPHPAAVLISGSGQQDRDSTIAGHKPFMVIADWLSRNGIAVARYDDRGVGESTGVATVPGATSEDFAEDAAAVVRWLRGVEGIDPDRIGLIGHSEGGVIAPMVAGADPRIAFVVLLAGSAVNGREILLLQGRLGIKAVTGAGEQDLDEIERIQAAALDLVIQGADSRQIHDAVIELSRAQLRTQGQELPEGGPIEAMIEAEIQRVTSPWMVFFLTYDPAPALEKLRCPVLALNGTLDLQVWHDQNLPVIEAAVARGGGVVTVKRYAGLNHLFQPAASGAFAEYSQIEATFDEQVLRDIVDWISREAD